MRYTALLLSAVLIAGVPAVAQSVPASTSSHAAKSAHAAPPAHPLTTAQAEELLKLTGADHMKKQMVDGMVAYLRQTFPPYVPKDVLTDFQTSLEKINVNSATIKIYKKHMSQKDAAAIIAFYKTPAGRHMMTEMPAIMSESRRAAAMMGDEVAHQVIERHKAEIEAAAKKYQASHSQASSSSQP